MAKRVLVIHPNQTSPDYNLLKVIYEGKGYDVIRDLNFSNEDLIKKIQSHDMIIFIDYSSNSDAISLYNNMDGTYRQIIDRSHVDLLKSKITHSICGCNRYFKENHISGLHTGFLITLSFTAYLCDIFEYDDEDIEKLVMPLMLSIRDNIEIEDYNEMKKAILQQYDAEDPITMFNRQSIIVL